MVMVCMCVLTVQSIMLLSSDAQFHGKLDISNYTIRSPRGLAMDNNGVVYVCDYSNNRVQVF